jgi:flagella basal body P-ring formation protein FlgA
MKTVLISFVLATLARAGCVAVSSDQIVARDLRDAVPSLQKLDPETPLGFSPLPGTQRILSTRELTLIAHRHGLTLISGDGMMPSVCVERAVRRISHEEMKAALVAALGMADAELDLIEFSQQPAPLGRLEFSRAGLNKPPLLAPDAPVLWRGRLVSDGQRSVMTWAKVKISVDRVVLVASEDIVMKTLVGADQIKEVHERQFPFVEPSLVSRDEIIGKIARRLIPAGQKFTPNALSEPTDISKGDMVHVKVVDGSATLSLDAVAQSSGKKGESIRVHNPTTGKNFRVVVDEKGRATVRSSPAA